MERKVSVKGRTEINLVFTRDDEFNEPIVTGYGIQEKGQITTSVSYVGEKEFENRSTTDAASALQGKASGLQVINTSNAPGSIAELRIRGYNSLSSEASAPIIVVDGLRVENLQYLDPSMVESVEVIKDAGAAAIYGAGANNGVVVVTTKKGGKGFHATYNGRFTYQTPGKQAEVMGAGDYIAFQKHVGNITDVILQNNGYDGQNTNWQSEMYASAWSQQHGLEFQGGNDKGHFFAAFNYLKNDGVARGNQDLYERITGQLNGDYQILKWLKFSTNNSFETWRTNTLTSGYGSTLNALNTFDPLTPVYATDESQFTPEYSAAYEKVMAGEANYTFYGNDNGLYAPSFYFKESTTGHPFVQRDRMNRSVGGRALRGATAIEVSPWPEYLTFTSRIGYRFTDNKSNDYSEPYYYSPYVKSDVYSLAEAKNSSTYYQWDNFLNFNHTFGKHTVGAMLGMSYKENNYENTRMSASGFDILKSYEPNFRYWDYLKENAVKNISGSPCTASQISYFTHLLYSYGGRYSVQASYSRDAFDSSRLSRDNRWATSYSFSAGWTLSNENFFKNNVSRDIVSLIKFRGSWGKIGNSDALSGYPYTAGILTNGQFYQYNNNDNLTYGSMPNRVANPDLIQETTEQYDLGFQLGFLRDRLNFSADWYKKTTKDLVINTTTLPEAGSSIICMNAGDVVNYGWDFDLGWKDHIGDFQYGINANLSTLNNKVERVDPYVGRITGAGVTGFNTEMQTVFEEGHSMWHFNGYKYAGVEEETGRALYYDKDGNKTATPTSSDRTDLGSTIPTLTYGISVYFAWKGIDLSVFGTGSTGNKLYYMSDANNSSKANTLSTFWKNSYGNARNAEYPDMAKVAGTGDTRFWSSDACLFDGSYFKFKQIQLGYTLPQYLTKRAAISALRFFVSLDDWFTITTYPGSDPETAMYNSSYARGFDTGSYPITKKMVFGVNLTF